MAISVPQIIAWIGHQGYLSPGGSFPSGRHIAGEIGCSVRQVMRAIHSLEEMGLLTIQPGSGVSLAGSAQKTKASVPERSVPAIRRRLEASIADGAFLFAQSLPKVEWLCKEWNTSTRTLAQACRELALQNLLFKRGKQLIVGSSLVVPERITDSLVSPIRRTIILVCNRPEEWAEFHGNIMDQAVRAIGSEADRAGVRLLPVLTGEDSGEQVFPRGRKEIRRIIEELGDAFLGCLLTPLRVTLEDFDGWCKWLIRFKKPVIWIQDDKPEIPVLDSPLFFRVSYGDWVGAGRETATDLAMDVLSGQGHKRVAFVCNGEGDFEWFRVRAERLVERGKTLGISIVSMELDWSDDEVVRKVLHEPGVTALIAPNDHYAMNYWRAFRMQKIGIPKDISLISFDNLAELKPYPISTIDFGMAKLGYSIFHLLLGAIPVQVGRGRHLFGECRLIDNGSIGLPTHPSFNF